MKKVMIEWQQKYINLFMKDKSNIKINSNKSFGIVFAIIFLIISLWPILQNNNIRIWSLIISFIFLILGLINSRFLFPLNRAWFKFGMFLGNFISPVLMVIIFFLIVTPTGLILKLLKKDLINQKKNNDKTYWISRKGFKSSMKNQF